MRCGNRLPFQIFPGVFSSIDSYSKKITNACHQHRSRLPRWFGVYGNAVRPIHVPHYSEFCVVDTAHGIRLTGMPDEILRKVDGSHVIVDYKTARISDAQDALLPLYSVQLNTYAYIAERCGIGRVAGLGIIYYEPRTDVTADDLDGALLDDGFAMPFKAHLIQIPMRPDTMIPPLLKQVRSICDCTVAPDSRDGCQDCLRLRTLLALTHGNRRNRAAVGQS